MFELSMHFKHKMIRIWQKFDQKFELSGTQFNHVLFKYAQPLLGNLDT